jgi:multidrug efflux pump subunit AcrA (membrane-fusion protein)
MTKRLKILTIAGSIVMIGIIVIIFVRIGISISKSRRAPRTFSYAVGVVPLKLEAVKVKISFTGTAEGDPQVKVYPLASGKFWGNNVSEGDWVDSGSSVASINRDIVGMNYQLSPVLAPVSGVVKRLFFTDRGTTVTLDKPIAEIADPRNIKVIINAGELDLPKLKQGMSAIISSLVDPSRIIEGSVRSVTPYVDSDTLTGVIVVRAPNPATKINVGSSVNVSIILGESKMFMAPQEAILSKLDKTFVFINSNGIARQTIVTQGYIQDNFVEIRGGFKEGDLLVVQGAFKLSDGAKIQTGEKPGPETKPEKNDKMPEKGNAKNTQDKKGPFNQAPPRDVQERKTP